MPLSVPSLATSITLSLNSVGILGQDVPKLANGVAKGLVQWAKSLRVVTVDAGTAGVGTGFVPWLFPAPLLVTNLLTTYVVNGHLGIMAPLEATGLANGIALGFSQGLIKTNHPSVGTGSGVAKIIPTPAFPNLMRGFASVQIKGTGAAKKANAISQALVMTLAVFTLPVPIVGSVSPSGAAGVGIGKIT